MPWWKHQLYCAATRTEPQLSVAICCNLRRHFHQYRRCNFCKHSALTVDSFKCRAYQVVITGLVIQLHLLVTLTVNSPITISAQQQMLVYLPTNAASFSVSAAGTGLTYQWQVSTNGGTSWTKPAVVQHQPSWVSLLAFNGNQHRVVLNGTCTTEPEFFSCYTCCKQPG